ncbi:hypothetical protein NDU88_002582 [Pleurodeles waltl]|uniref:Uncharacterized protein n=1 Tax=Pleurodeles waltl TaxID=8319 RepID=A0AAV7T3R1_PLEWA|nr:hypothetical protein NDU88_002582 [Pleurodeles waltl]
METHREGGGSRPRSSGLPRVKKGTAGRDRSALPDAKRTPRERRRKRVRRGETESQTPEKRRREASTRNTREERRKKGRKSHPERRRRTRQPATAQEGRGWTRFSTVIRPARPLLDDGKRVKYATIKSKKEENPWGRNTTPGLLTRALRSTSLNYGTSEAPILIVVLASNHEPTE